jgi:hypothetical protein
MQRIRTTLVVVRAIAERRRRHSGRASSRTRIAYSPWLGATWRGRTLDDAITTAALMFCQSFERPKKPANYPRTVSCAHLVVKMLDAQVRSTLVDDPKTLGT